VAEPQPNSGTAEDAEEIGRYTDLIVGKKKFSSANGDQEAVDIGERRRTEKSSQKKQEIEH